MDYDAKMNTIRIIRGDADHVGPKVFFGSDRELGDGYYTMKAESVNVLITQVDEVFGGSIHLDGVKDSIRKAVRLNGGEVALAGPSDMWIDFIRQNRVRLGKHSRPLVA